MSDGFQFSSFDAAVQADVVEAMFGKPLVTNVFRSLLVEAMIVKALGPQWRWCAADFAPWDLEHESGLKLEVKQSAARQSWPQTGANASSPRFDIAHRTGRWEGPTWVKGRTRHADIYIFAYHPLTDDRADHRCSAQWRFHVVPTPLLPETASISLARLNSWNSPINLPDIGEKLQALASTPKGLSLIEKMK